MRGLAQDVRYGLKSLRSQGLFAAVVVGTLSLGIAANTVVFSAVDGMVLNPFPYPEPERLVGIGPVFPRTGQELSFWEVLSPPEYRDIQRRSRTLERVVAWDMGHRQLTTEDEATNVFTAFWWGDAFGTLGVEPAMGRGFTEEELRRGDPVTILSHRLWRQRFGGDPDLVGGTVQINGRPYTVVGVMPPGTLVYETEIWLPMGVSPDEYARNRRQMQVLARIAPGATLEDVNVELETLAGRIEAAHGGEFQEYAGWRLEARTWTDINVRSFRPMFLMLLGAVGFVLLLVCANVANLLVARSARRRRELAVRRALGAGRLRLVRQLLAESVLLGLAGGAAGILVSLFGIRGLDAYVATSSYPLPGEVALNTRVLLFTGGISVLGGLVFGLIPALEAGRGELAGALMGEGRGSSPGRGRRRLQGGLVGLEVALALVLLVGCGLLVNSLVRLQGVDPGVREEGVLSMRLTLPWEEYDAQGITTFFQELTRRVEGLPGVRSAGVGSQFPPVVFGERQIRFETADGPAGDDLPEAFTTLVGEGYFPTLGMDLIRGRLPGDEDRPGSSLVAVVNQAFVRRYLPGRDPLGRRVTVITRENGGPVLEIVGVVADARNRGLTQPAQPEIFASIQQLQGASNQLFLLVHAEVEPYSLLPAIKQQVRSLDADQPVYAVNTMGERLASMNGDRRAATVSLALFSFFALLLAAVGIYGVVSYTVAERTQELGIRIAMGASTRGVRRLVVSQTLLPVLLGAGSGLVAAVLLGRSLGGLLYQVEPSDPLTLSVTVAILGGVAVTASWLPARRASRLDPVEALRSE